MKGEVVSYSTGARLYSATSACEVVVIKVGDGGGEIRCAGEPMVSAATGSTDRGEDASQLVLGKRYVHEPTGLEVLCVKAGAGPLTFDGAELTLKSAKPLPASD